MVEETKSDRLIVTQANALAVSAQKMTLQEKRLLLLIISNVRISDNEFTLYHIPISSIVEYLEINDKSIYTEVKVISKKLLSRVLEIEVNDGEWKQFQWVSSSEYKKRENSPIGAACIEIELHKKLHPFLLNLKKRFGSIPLRQIATMHSVNSIRLLEILYFQSHNVNIRELYFDLVDLKKRLGLEGMYNNFAFFRRDVLERARLECSEKSPITFSYKPKKSGRKVIGLDFEIRRNKNKKIIKLPKVIVGDLLERDEPEVEEQAPPPDIPSDFYQQLLNHGLKSNQIRDFLNNPDIGITGIEEGFRYYKRQLDEDKIHSNKSAYLANSIQKKWGEKTLEEKIDEQRKKDIAAARITIEENKNILEKLNKDKNKYLEDKAESIIKSLTPDVKKVLEKECVSLLNDFERKIYNPSNVLKPMKFRSFIRDKFVEDTDEDVLDKIALEKEIYVGAVNGKIQAAKDVLKKHGVV